MIDEKKRNLAAQIANDLVECGVDTHHTVTVLSKSYRISPESVRIVKRIVKRMGKEMQSSMVDAIENGWEDERLADFELPTEPWEVGSESQTIGAKWHQYRRNKKI